MSNSKESPQKKRKVEASPSSSPLSCLPDDLAISILARVSRLDHAALSLVSKSYRHLVASPDLYKMRSLMGRNETYLYVCLRTPPPDPNSCWYILRRKRTLDASSNLIPIPSLPCQAPEASSVVVLDWGIYVFGGLIKGKPTSAVWLLDCRTHTWRSVPSMGVARANAAAGVVDGKIYVFGGCKLDDYTLCWGEVLDPKTQTWGTLPHMPDRKKHDQYIQASVVRDHKVYAVNDAYRTFYYSPSQGQWGRGNRVESLGNGRDWCMIDNLLYCINAKGTIFWWEPDVLDWPREPEGMYLKEVKGLGSLWKNLFHSRVIHFGEDILDRWEQRKIKLGLTNNRLFQRYKSQLVNILPGARLSNSGSNIVIVWDFIERDHLEIWCTEISLERRGSEIWGSIESSNAVMTVYPFLDRYNILDRYKVLHSVSVTL